MSTVELVNVSKIFSGNHKREFLAVDSLNLQIASGEFFSLLGSSGCGKTTSLRMIAGFETPTHGEIYLDNQPMGKTPPFHRPVNTVFQNYALFPHLKVSENISFGLEMENLSRSQIRARVGEVLAMVQLNGLENRYPRQLSGGQQQRVALARSLVKKPKVLLLDEPLGALDLKLRKEMQLELKHMQQQIGITFIYVTHDQEEALTMSDRLGIMSEGKLLQVGTPRDIYDHPESLFVADFIGEANILSGRVIKQINQGVVVLVENKFAIPVAFPEGLSVDTLVNLVIRPEKIEIHPNNNDSELTYSGEIQEIIYLGNDTKYVIKTSDVLLTVRQQNLYSNFCTKESVKIKIAPQYISLLPKG